MIAKSLSLVLTESAARPPSLPIPTSSAALNALVGGFRPRNLLLIMAPPGGTKSAWTVHEGIFVARTGTPVLFVELEIDEEELAARAAGHELGESAVAVLERRVQPSDAQKAIDGLPIYVTEVQIGQEDAIKQIAEAAAEIAERHGKVPLIVVDFIQLLAIGARETRHAITNAIYGLKSMARDLDAAVIVVSSTNRTFYGKKAKKEKAEDKATVEDPRDWLSAGSESGGLEFAAGTAIYLELGEQDASGESDARLIVSKARHGRVGFVGARVTGRTGAFKDCPEALARLGVAVKVAEKEKTSAAPRLAVSGNSREGPSELQCAEDRCTRQGRQDRN